MNPTTRTTAPRTRRRRFMTAGVVAAGLSLAGAGAAMAGDTTPGGTEVSGPADAALPAPAPVEAAAAAVPAPVDAPAAAPAPAPAEVPAPADEAPAPIPGAIDLPDPDEVAYGGYTQERADAFWGAGYGWADVEALVDLWQLDYAETKARAGQMILDGETVPVAPTGPDVWVEPDPSSPESILFTQYGAFWDAGYTDADLLALNALWNSDYSETKARAGQMILDGLPLPIAPASTPAG